MLYEDKKGNQKIVLQRSPKKLLQGIGMACIRLMKKLERAILKLD